MTLFETASWTVRTQVATVSREANKRPLIVDVDGRYVGVAQSWSGPLGLHDPQDFKEAFVLQRSGMEREFKAALMVSSRGLFAQAYGNELIVGDARVDGPPLAAIYTHPVVISHLLYGGGDLIWVAGGQKIVGLRGKEVVAELATNTQITALSVTDQGRIFYGDQQGRVRCMDAFKPTEMKTETLLLEDDGGRFLAADREGTGVAYYRHALPQAHWVSMSPGTSSEPVPELRNLIHARPPYRLRQGLPCSHPLTGEIVCAGEATLNLHHRDSGGPWQTRQLSVKPKPVSAVFVSQGTGMIVSCEEGLWIYESAASVPKPAPFPAKSSGVLDLSADGQVALFAGNDDVWVWEVATGRVRYHREISEAVGALHPSGRYLALSPHDHTIEILDLAAPGRPPSHVLRCGGRWLYGLHFTPDGSRLYTTGSEQNCHWWDWSLGEKLLTLTETGNVVDVALSRDGRTVWTTAAGVAVHTRRALPWDLDQDSAAFRHEVEKLRH